MKTKGFTLVEVIVSVVILAVAILGLSAATTSLIGRSTEATTHARALNVVEDRLALIRLHPIYEELEDLFVESDEKVPELPEEFRRSTSITRVRQAVPGGPFFIDYTRITVSVDGPGLDQPISRTAEVGGS